jgi:transcriptional regulator with XRE-family HTH domain
MRRKRGATQSEVATVMGVTQAAISNYENGHRTPDVAVVHSYANALGASPLEVLEMANIEHLSPPVDFVDRACQLAAKINERSKL